MRQCKDCKYSIDPGEYAKCTHPIVTKSDSTTGWPIVKYCELERWFIHGKCGYFGRYYERKEAV